MRLIVAGSRGFSDYDLLSRTLDEMDPFPIQIVSGGARGADSLGERWARERGVPVRVFRADWDSHGKAAGAIRNGEMAAHADAAVVFWDGTSSGSRHMIETMRRLRKPLFEVMYNDPLYAASERASERAPSLRLPP